MRSDETLGEELFFDRLSRLAGASSLVAKEKQMRISIAAVLSTAALMAFAPACKKSAKETPPVTAPVEGSASPSAVTEPPPTQVAPSKGSAAVATLTDPQIAAIVVAANQVDIDAGELALKKSKNEEVKKFAQRMVTDHTAVNKSAVDLVTKLKVTPAESDASRSLASGGTDARAKLEKLDGDAFDRAYVDNEVAYHKAVIGVLDSQLIPSASNPELKSTLISVKPAFDAHLQHAVQIQAALAGSGSAAHAHGN
jgi:putative membrane protein